MAIPPSGGYQRLPSLRDALMKNLDLDPSAVDLSPAERDAHDEELVVLVRYQRVVGKLAECGV
ncbi:hypothetical protein IW261DRAFT_1610580 [Armillaria novae-zelandiae]|uniref:Uncharacterized protein n=1 Tax=Armillaria novae-zelandiae TaxID=153914 RepID=A0AA39U9P6_9AGAR|nr:hypothetical protein IW261DRAFT_1610580 [Armillaria novae-zelandiae]